MPDISKCSNSSCKLKENCYRWTSEPSYWQSYCYFKPVGNSCKFFWKNKQFAKNNSSAKIKSNERKETT